MGDLVLLYNKKSLLDRPVHCRPPPTTRATCCVLQTTERPDAVYTRDVSPRTIQRTKKEAIIEEEPLAPSAFKTFDNLQFYLPRSPSSSSSPSFFNSIAIALYILFAIIASAVAIAIDFAVEMLEVTGVRLVRD